MPVWWGPAKAADTSSGSPPDQASARFNFQPRLVAVVLAGQTLDVVFVEVVIVVLEERHVVFVGGFIQVVFAGEINAQITIRRGLAGRLTGIGVGFLVGLDNVFVDDLIEFGGFIDFVFEAFDLILDGSRRIVVVIVGGTRAAAAGN